MDPQGVADKVRFMHCCCCTACPTVYAASPAVTQHDRSSAPFSDQHVCSAADPRLQQHQQRRDDHACAAVLQGIYGSAASPVVDKSLSTGTDHKLSPAAAERSRSSDVPALPAHRHTSDSTSTDLQLQHGLPNGSKMHRNDTHDASSQPSMTAKEQSTALLDRASLGQEYHAQAGKPAESHSIKLADIASTKTTQNVTIKSESQSANVVQHPPKADRVDLLIVMPSSIDRMPMVTASRGWRQGVQTYVAFEQEIDLATAPAVFKVLNIKAVCFMAMPKYQSNTSQQCGGEIHLSCYLKAAVWSMRSCIGIPCMPIIFAQAHSPSCFC